MLVKLINAVEHGFTNKKAELVKGWNLTFLDQQNGDTFRHFVGNDNLKGFDPDQLCEITGKDLEVSTTAKTYEGKTRIVLDNISELE